MKYLLISLFIFGSLKIYSQDKNDYYFENPKVAVAVSIPFGASLFVVNLKDRFGFYFNFMYKTKKGYEDDNYISPYHEIFSEEIIGRTSFELGGTARIWKPFHLYFGIGAGWKINQVIYKDTPPVVLPDAYRIVQEGALPKVGFGLLFIIKAISISGGYDTYEKKPVFSIGIAIGGN